VADGSCEADFDSFFRIRFSREPTLEMKEKIGYACTYTGLTNLERERANAFCLARAREVLGMR